MKLFDRLRRFFSSDRSDPDQAPPAAPSAKARLTFKQRMQVRYRRIRTVSWPVAAFAALGLLLLCCLFSCVGQKAAPLPAAVPDGSVVMDFVGDVMLGRSIQKLGRRSGYDALFENVSGYWKRADLTFANLESAVLRDSETYDAQDKGIHLSTDYEGLGALIEAGVNAFSLANNHSFDYGEQALTELETYLREQQIYYAGIGTDLNDAVQARLIEVDGRTIAFLSIAQVFFPPSTVTEDQAGVLSVLAASSAELVRKASAEADITIVYVHWGEENISSVKDEQTALGHRLIEAGADIVIGAHPHVLQEIERYGDGIIFYSLGNFVFDQGNTFACDSVLVEYVLDEDDHGFFRLYPIRIRDGVPAVTANRFYRWRINRRLVKALSKDAYAYDENGCLVIPFDVS